MRTPATNPAVRGRYAPSPSGRMHLGNARTALLAWLHTRALGGTFVLRIEDIDRERCRASYELMLLDDLRWLGLDWEEGPDVGGPHAPYRQSERTALYEEALRRLDTYPCTCTRRELREAARAPHDAAESPSSRESRLEDGQAFEPVYPGTCRHGPTHPERPKHTRWRVPEGLILAQDELVSPLVEDVASAVGDLVLRRADGMWAYQLAVVVDDAEMGITHVVRGADLRGSTPRQIALQRALGLPTPTYVHVPLLLGPDGHKLSKRHGARDLGELRDAGVTATSVVYALASSAGLIDAGSTLATLVNDPDPRPLLGALVGAFELSSLRETPARSMRQLLERPPRADPAM